MKNLLISLAAIGMISALFYGGNKSKGTIILEQPLKVDVGDITLKQARNNSESKKVFENYFCEGNAGLHHHFCVSLVSDGESIYYSIVCDSESACAIGNIALAVNGIPVVDVCKKCVFKPVIESDSRIIFGSARANESLAKSINSISYNNLKKDKVEEVYLPIRVKLIAEAQSILNDYEKGNFDTKITDEKLNALNLTEREMDVLREKNRGVLGVLNRNKMRDAQKEKSH